MYKRFLALLLAAVAGVTVSSAHKFSLINESSSEKGFSYLLYGDSSLMSQGKTIELVMDFSRAEIVDFDKDFNITKRYGSIDDYNRSLGQQAVDSWEEDKLLLEERVCAHLDMIFASDCETVGHIGNPAYRMVIRIGLFDFGHKAPLAAKDGGMAAKGLIEIYAVTTGELTAVFDINYVRGKNSLYGKIDRIREFAICFARGIKKPMKLEEKAAGKQ